MPAPGEKALVAQRDAHERTAWLHEEREYAMLFVPGLGPRLPEERACCAHMRIKLVHN